MDERQEIIDKNVLVRAFGILLFLIIIYIVTIGFIKIDSTMNQLILIGILTLTSIYIWIDSFINKILYYNIKTKQDINKKVKKCSIGLLCIDLLILLFSFNNIINIKISVLFLLTLFVINIIILGSYYFILFLWITWYK